MMFFRSLPAVAFYSIALMAVILMLDSLIPKSTEWLFINYAGLAVGMSAGLFGASFSMLVQSQRRISQGSIDDSEVASEWHVLIIRGAFGIGAATIIYFFFKGNLLAGSLFPNLNKIGYEVVTGTRSFKVPNQDLCLLVIWCFIAGFSETLVPNILVSTENRTNQKSP